MKKDNGPLDVSQEMKMVLPFPNADLEAIGQLLAKTPFPFYALLLGRETDKNLASFVAENWKALHRMSGKNCLLLSAFPPKEAIPELDKEWEGKLGEAYKEFARAQPDLTWSYDIAAQMQIPYGKLPCLYLCDSLEASNGAVLKLPDWSSADLTLLFESIFQALNKVQPDDPHRMDAVTADLKDYPLEKIRIFLKEHWQDYVNVENVKTAIEILISGILGALKKAVGVPAK